MPLKHFVDIAHFRCYTIRIKGVNALNERIKKLRKVLDLTQQEFADRLSIKRNTVATYERGKSDPSDAAVILICKTFNVSEKWLRTGEGGDAAMFVEVPKNEALAAQIESFLQGGTDSFRERLVSLLLRLSPEQWGALEGYLLELTAPRAFDPAHADTDDDIERDVENYRHRRLLEKNQAEKSSPLSGDDTETA